MAVTKKKKPVGLEYRMYGFVPYNLSDIQKGIQFGHAVVEYAFKYGGTKEFKEFARDHKTFIILNGGTTNSNLSFGLQSITEQFTNEMPGTFKYAVFNEPDLNDALTAIVFLVDSRVFDNVNYPCPFNEIKGFSNVPFDEREDFLKNLETVEYLNSANTFRFDPTPGGYQRWVKYIGGVHNAFLKYYLPKFRLA